MAYGKIGILAPEQHGDIALCTSILKYKDILWPEKDIVWFANLAPHKATYLDMLKFNDAITEIRDWPQFTTMDHFRACIDINGHFIGERKYDFESTKDLDYAYFPAPWCVLPNNKYNGVHYANIPRIVYGANNSWEWHPYLCFSEEEHKAAKEFCSALPHTKTVMLETELRSAGNFQLPEDSIRNIMQACREKFGKCNFIFASKIDYSKLVDDIGVVSCSQFTVRQTALVHNYCDLFIGVSSGITQAVSCWNNKPVPRVEMCGTPIASSIIANGPVNTFICDNLSLEQMKRGFENAVKETLNKF